MSRTQCAILTVIISTAPAFAQELITFPATDDVALCLSAASGDPLAGYASGRIAKCDADAKTCHDLFKAPTGGVLAMLPMRNSLVASTSAGQVIYYRNESSTNPAWTFTSTCEVSCLAEFPDLNADATPEILAAGADHRVHMLNGNTGEPIWATLFETPEGDRYINRILVIDDHDSDNTPDVAAWMWSGHLAVLSGESGKQIWAGKLNTGFVDACVLAPDCDHDNLQDFLTGGNDGVIRLSSSRDGTELWTARLDRPIRAIALSKQIVFACTAGGEVASFDLAGREAEARWRFNVGDVCRDLIALEHASSTQVAVCAENGIVTILSARDGKPLRAWQSQQELRTIAALPSGHVAVASLDGTIGLIPLSPQSVPATWPADLRINANAPALAPHTPIANSASREPRVLILLYHDVVPEVFYHYGASVETFRAHMDLLKSENYTCVSLDQIADWIEGRGGMPERAVCITFDGPYQGHYTYAYPILREHDLFATSYITTDWIGSVNHADWHQLREMDAAGIMDIQNHSTNHASLSRCPRDEVIRQLAGCNDAIRRHLRGKTSRHHAYPSGAYNDQARAVLRDLGFRTATTVVRRPVSRTDDLLLLPRYMICTHTTLDQFRAWLTGTEPPPVRH